MKKTLGTTLLLALAALTSGCMRGGTSTQPPVHLVQDMDFQPKMRTQAKTDFEGWADGRTMRLPVADPSSQSPLGKTLVVARGSLPDPKMANRDANKAYVTKNPLPVSAEVLARGRERFDINCAVCHGYSGQGGNGNQGHGMVGRLWPVAIPNFHFVEGKDNRVPNMADGEYFEVITYGVRTMPAYGARLSVEDRWAIVHYVRALQNLSK
jgi:mono/diheme cytochrome c family protein